MTDLKKETIEALKEGNKSAFKEVIAFYEKRLYAFIFSLTKSKQTTEDILQEVFIKLWTIKEILNPELTFNAFIYKIARNLTFNHLRKVANQNALRESLWNDINEMHESTENTIIFNDYEVLVNKLLKDLPKQKRNIFILSKQQGKSNQEIAKELGISQKTVKNHLWKTMQIIREKLMPYLTESLYILAFLGLYFI
ncbi:RNA polymerase sigma factor [Snuella sedimenti]|uniref:RNA polymerase sigma-70 factor n=1 Tax=Snuella sedimenti TaxID=2798802 RepID=A0A8J7JD62_9FLAO|nr:RNA polymerase sigma-70 factor [Snuella sedimenti]MBJ6368809.1 RNA polymerase sigma-70 factor [Snuella sedimenti]